MAPATRTLEKLVEQTHEKLAEPKSQTWTCYVG